MVACAMVGPGSLPSDRLSMKSAVPLVGKSVGSGSPLALLLDFTEMHCRPLGGGPTPDMLDGPMTASEWLGPDP